MTTKQLLGRTKRARRNLALKLILERRFLPELTIYFNRILRNFRTLYIATGMKLDVSTFNRETTLLIRRQYIRTAKAFSNEMRLALAGEKNIDFTKQIEENDQFDPIIDAALFAYINEQVPQTVAKINQTTTKNIADSLQQGTAQILEEGGDINERSVGLAASIVLKRKLDGRKTTISMTETQFMAESTKAIESAVVGSEGQVNPFNIIGATAIIAGAANINKSWASILDGDTRQDGFDHVEPDGQNVKWNQPFIVSSEKLMFPGDRSLGASIGNIANCRCSAIYRLLGVTVLVITA